MLTSIFPHQVAKELRLFLLDRYQRPHDRERCRVPGSGEFGQRMEPLGVNDAQEERDNDDAEHDEANAGDRQVEGQSVEEPHNRGRRDRTVGNTISTRIDVNRSDSKDFQDRENLPSYLFTQELVVHI